MAQFLPFVSIFTSLTRHVWPFLAIFMSATYFCNFDPFLRVRLICAIFSQSATYFQFFRRFYECDLFQPHLDSFTSATHFWPFLPYLSV